MRVSPLFGDFVLGWETQTCHPSNLPPFVQLVLAFSQMSNSQCAVTVESFTPPPRGRFTWFWRQSRLAFFYAPFSPGRTKFDTASGIHHAMSRGWHLTSDPPVGTTAGEPKARVNNRLNKGRLPSPPHVVIEIETRWRLAQAGFQISDPHYIYN